MRHHSKKGQTQTLLNLYRPCIGKGVGRNAIRDNLAVTIRSHYDRLERITEDVDRLGYKMAAKILSEAMPQTPKGRSGDLGESLATELAEEEIGLRVPVNSPDFNLGVRLFVLPL